MNKEAIDLLIAKEPRLRAFRDKLEAMKPGAYCIHRSWGLGRIQAYEEQDRRLIIDFEGHAAGHSMDPAFCVDKLEVLPDKSILVRHRQKPEEIEEIARKRPADLIVAILDEREDKSAAISEIERTLHRLLGEARARKWWTATKKLLVKDPRVQVPVKKTDPYVLREEPVKAEDEVLEEFFETKAAKKKIALAEKLLSLSVTHDDIKEALPDVLKVLALALQETKAINTGERLHGIWVRNDLARFLHDDVEVLIPTSASLILECRDLSQLGEQIPSSYQKRYLDLIVRCFPQEGDWSDIVLDLLKNSQGKFTGECLSFLLERQPAQQVADVLMRWLDEQTLRGPLILWLMKNRNTRKYQKLVQGLMGPRLLAAIFYAIDYEALQNTGTKRIPLADFISDDVELIPELLANATPETARDLATTLLLNQGFEDLDKKSLLARFIRQFPSIQSLVAGDAPTSRREERLVVSQESFERRKGEYDDLVTRQIPENKESIAVAREHGDLRENAEYKMARQDQETLMARKGQLESELSRAQVTDFTDAPVDRVGIGSVVELLRVSSGEIVRYSVLGAWDSNPAGNVISYQTPLSQSIIGHLPGETVTIEVDGEREQWTIRAISRWVDQPVKS